MDCPSGLQTSGHGNHFHSITEVISLHQVHQYVLLPLTSFLLNSHPLKVNNSGFDLLPVNVVLSHDLKKGNTELKMQ